MAKTRLLLFDLDWTLIYTGGAGVRALNRAFDELFHIQDSMNKVSPDGKTDPAIVREMIQVHLQRAPHNGEVEAVCKGYLRYLKDEVAQGQGYRVLPGIPELLKALSVLPDVYLGLGTGNLEEGARIKLGRCGLMPYFKYGGYSSDAEERPAVLEAAVRRGEALAGGPVPRHQVTVLGDNMRDILAGKAIGARTVGVASGPMTYDELAKHSPDLLFKDFSKTEEVVRELMHVIAH